MNTGWHCIYCEKERVPSDRFCTGCGEPYLAPPPQRSTETAETYYEVLGIPDEADGSEIRSAYRRAAMRWHPDCNQGSKESEERFKLIAQAYNVLSNPESRKRYDEMLTTGAAYTEKVSEQSYEEAASQFLEEMYSLAVQLTLRNVSRKQIARELEHQGCPTTVAVYIATAIETQRKAAMREAGRILFMKGLGSFILGSIITGGIYLAAAGSGIYIVTWGLMVYGVFQMLRGIYHLLSGRSPQ